MGYLPKFSARFGVKAAQPGSAYRPWPADLSQDAVFCFKHRRTVNNDNTVSFDGHKLQIPPGRDRISYARAHVEVQQRLDGSLAIVYQGQTLAVYQSKATGPIRVGEFTPADLPEPGKPVAEAKKVRTPTTERRPYKPPADHPWRQPFAAKRRR